jgi:hypothetical protein
MSKVLIFVLIGMLSGCANPVDPRYMDRAKELCEMNGGIKSFAAEPPIFFHKVVCNNTARFKVKLIPVGK